MFRGANALNLDTKGRFAIPTRYRERLLEDCEGQLICTVDLNQPCLLLYPLHEWEEIEKKLRHFSSMVPQERAIQRILLGYASECEMDKSGRILLTGPLRQYAELDKQLMLIGQLNKFEIWNEATWHARIKEDMQAQLDGELELTDNLRSFSL